MVTFILDDIDCPYIYLGKFFRVKTKKMPSRVKKGSKEKNFFRAVLLVWVTILGWPVINCIFEEEKTLYIWNIEEGAQKVQKIKRLHRVGPNRNLLIVWICLILQLLQRWLQRRIPAEEQKMGGRGSQSGLVWNIEIFPIEWGIDKSCPESWFF